MDPTGTELTFIYKNQLFRRFRNDKPEQTMTIAQLADPPQGEGYKPLAGDLFPTKYPLEDAKRIRAWGYFFRKYYITQRLFLSFAKKAQYCNYEVLVNAFTQKVMDMSKAEIIRINTSDMGLKEFEQFVSNQDRFSEYQVDLLSDKMQEL